MRIFRVGVPARENLVKSRHTAKSEVKNNHEQCSKLGLVIVLVDRSGEVSLTLRQPCKLLQGISGYLSVCLMIRFLLDNSDASVVRSGYLLIIWISESPVREMLR